MTIYYLDKYGGKVAGDGSFANPWRCFADIGTLLPNDRVRLKRGDKYRETLTIGESGNQWADIFFEAWDGSYANPPLIDGADKFEGFIRYGSEKLYNGSLEYWNSGGGVPDGWIKQETGTSYIEEETSEVKHLDSSAAFVHDGSGSALELRNDDPFALDDDTEYRFSMEYYNPQSDDSSIDFLGVAIYRDLAPTSEYLQANGTWDGAIYYFPLLSGTHVSPYWEEYLINFDTGANPNGKTDYYVSVKSYGGPFAPVNKTIYVDKLSLGEVLTDPVGNKVSNSDFEFWSSGFPTNYTSTIVGNGSIEQSTNKKWGDYGVKFLLVDDPNSDVGLKQQVALADNTTYRVSIFHFDREYAEEETQEIALAIRVYDTTTELYWDDSLSSWVADVTDNILDHEPEWENDGIEITTPVSGSSTYDITIHRSDDIAQSPGFLNGQDIYIDMFVVLKKDQDREIISIPVKDPKFVYVVGTIGGGDYDNSEHSSEPGSFAYPFQLHYEGDTDHPRLYCWGYDPIEEILYISIGQDSENVDVYVSVREENINFNGQSYITVKDIHCSRAWGTGVNLHYTEDPGAETLADFATDLTVKNVRVDHPGWLGIQMGYRPIDPVPYGDIDSNKKLTPRNVLIEDCDVYMFNRCGIIKLPFTSPTQGYKPWGLGYGVPNAGIRAFKGTGASAYGGTLTVRRCNVVGDFPLINFSTGRNGIAALWGANVLFEQNYVTKVDHALVAVGPWMGGTGSVAVVTIKHNFVWQTGDDGIWLNGMATPNNKVCYNVVGNVQDNCLDLMDVELVEVYNNTFYDNVNEMISIWGSIGYASRAWIFNNIFCQWGEYFRTNVSSPRKALGVAIGFGHPNVDKEASVIDYNIYYQASTAETYGYPAHYIDADEEYHQMTFEELQALGYEEHGRVIRPQLYDPSNGLLYIKRNSPAIHSGLDLSACKKALMAILPASPYSEQGLYYFDRAGVEESQLSASSSWPDSVSTEEQETNWNIGAYAPETPTLTKASGDPDFAVDGSMIGAPVYLVATAGKRIWKGIVIAATEDVLTLDDWQPLFNAEGVLPYGDDYEYYIGYIYLYDKTGRISVFNEYWLKNLKSYELLTNKIEEDVTVFFRFSGDHGKTVHAKSGTLDADKPNIHIFDLAGLNKNFVLEHALLSNQEFRVKGSVYHADWMRGYMVQ